MYQFGLLECREEAHRQQPVSNHIRPELEIDAFRGR
jgi:hypothetical protein